MSTTPMVTWTLFSVLLAASPALSTTPAGKAIPRHVNAHVLRQRVMASARKIPEFRSLAKLANAAGYNVFLLGGAAGNLVNHARLEMLQQSGDSRLRPEYFKGPLRVDKIMNLFTQDVDLVISRQDGRKESAAEIQRFQDLIRTKVHGLQLDVRGLHTAKDDIHPPLLDNHEFLSMHHNSVDYLMVQLNAPDAAQCVRDLSAWHSATPPALHDLAQGVIHFFPSPTHSQTKLARSGASPDMKHVIRLLIKAARYDLKLDPASQRTVKRMVERWTPNGDGDIFARWLGENAIKLAADAINLEQAWNTYDALGLRPKLQALRNQGGANLEEVAKLFGREPLRTATRRKPRRKGKTAEQLDISLLTHTTSDLKAWNSITRTPYWHPNFFQSRQQGGGSSEVALQGDGLYAMVGQRTYKDGHQVALRLDPTAVEGVDFQRGRAAGGVLDHPFVIVKNKAKLRLVDKSMKSSPKAMIQELMNDKSLGRAETRDFYLGQLAKRHLRPAELALYHRLAQKALNEMNSDNAEGVLQRVFAVRQLFGAYPKLADRFIEKVSDDNLHLVLGLVERYGHTPEARHALALGLRKFGDSLGYSLAQYFFPQDTTGYFNAELRELIRSGDFGVHQYLVYYTFTHQHIDRYTTEAKLLLSLIDTESYVTSIQQAARARLADPGLSTPVRTALKKLIGAAESRLRSL